MDKYKRLGCDLTFLKECLNKNIVPKGLQVCKFPNRVEEESEFHTELIQIFDKCGLDVVRAIIAENDRVRNILLRKMESINTSIINDLLFTVESEKALYHNIFTQIDMDCIKNMKRKEVFFFSQIPHSVCSESCLPGYQKVSRQGQPICCFDCLACSKGEISNQTDAVNCLKCSEDFWSNDKRDMCISKSLEYLSFEDPVGALLVVCSSILSLLTVSILYIFIKFKDTPIVKANNRELSYFLLLSLTLCFLCSFLFIGQPLNLNCMFRQAVFGLTFSLCVSCILAKTVTVVIAFSATKPDSRLKNWVGSRVSTSIVIFGALIQVIICLVWLCLSAPFPELNRTSKDGKIIIECNEGSVFAFWTMLGYLGLLAAASFVVAFLARNLPGSFNEAKYITFSMLVFVIVWLSFIPAYLSTRGKYMVAVEVFAILASSAGMLGCIFLPKCYIIILRPELNTRGCMVGKGEAKP
ncbi:vomeronasal type-2 receptor 26-like [Protopterus annectens]|uniref:vomeronasal type-2 receptor 26-like n=1 Tax=Protopterus annectens TaxID=7888 RepID=UPI001CFC1E2F|nr:vomeronasal type-2 receptor 26-like [Protopterus annectens]